MNFRHIVLALILASYAVGGMFLFFAIEGPHERNHVHKTRVELNEAFAILANDFRIAAEIPNSNMSLLLKKAYLTLLRIDEKYIGSTFYKLEERDYPMWTWSHGSAFFFAFTLYSTVGYGSIAPSTDWGRAATIIYTAIGFPVALIIIRDIGSLVLVVVTRIYARCIIKMRKACGYAARHDAIMLPMKFALFLSFLYCFFTSLFIMFYDSMLGPEPGLDLFHSFYFTFLSFAAVGLGDVMPVNYNHSPVVACVLLGGFPLMRVINRVLYVGIENGIFSSMTVMEESIDKLQPEGEGEDHERIATVAENIEVINN
ncbi:hypothetical protein PFISCL1PPCAC_21966 [Pristionchus fissidentatus]|uniref:Potassium channel domain-containing protein n=1 Tax=Pristionchus fissidentatus TaxID=1538716 RepID=A0AAV5WLM1_9BILA|nr:hypothetical protein PFISCL1PPCAC_21966 [Pristionchus fissidentatus]